MSLLKKESDAFFVRAAQGLFGLKRAILVQNFSDCAAIQAAIQQK